MRLLNWFTAMAAVLSFGVFSLPQAARADGIYYIGNSVTDTVNRDALVEMAAARGSTQLWGRQMIPGAPLEWLWDHPADGFTQSPYNYPSNALPNYPWDVLSLQPFDRSLESDIDYGGRFIAQLFGTSGITTQQNWNRSNARIFIYGRWPRQDDPARVGGVRTYDQLWLRQYPEGGSNAQESAEFATELTQAFKATSVSGISLNDKTFMVPVGHVMYELNQQMKADQVPGFKGIFEIYSDGIHLTNVGSYLTTLTFFTVMYRETPVGLGPGTRFNPSTAADTKDRTITPELATIIQNTVWNVCQTQVLSGVPSSGTMLLTTAAVPSGYLNQAYSTSLLAVGGTLPRTFARTAGTLPAGITLSAAGVLSGTPTQSGAFDFTVTVTDSKSPTPLSVSRAYRLNIEVDTDPVITTAPSLPGGNKGSRYNQQLGVTGGNGQLSWSITSGSLPTGLVLGGGGTLIGTPVQTGTFNFTARVVDSDVPADADTENFTLVIGNPTAKTLSLAKTNSPVRIDGDLAETHWTALASRTAANGLLGMPNNTTAFDALWDNDNLYLAVRVTDSQLASPGTGADRDSVEIFLDAFNDKQAEFNSQHRQFRVALDGSLFERGGRSTGVKTALVMIPGGYQIEMQVPWTNLGISPSADNTVIGLDVANNDVDTGVTRQHFQAFADTSASAPSPAQFGNAILTSSTVSGTGGEPFGVSGPAPAVYEGFAYTAGQTLHGRNGGTGWSSGGTWEVEGGTNATGFTITGTESLAYGQLGTSGIVMSGGHGYQTSGRGLDTGSSGALAAWRRSDGYIGKDGTTLWISYLVKPRDSGVYAKFSLDEGGAVYHDNNGRLRVHQSNGKWNLSLMNAAVSQLSSVNISGGTTYFMVLKLSFGSTDTVELFINPTLGVTAPTTASATCTTTDANFRFGEVNIYPNNESGAAQFDEIRMGDSWAAVAPQPALQVAPVTFSPLGGPIAGNTSVTLACATSGATIRYTTDGSNPTSGSTAYSSAFSVAPGTSVKAKAFKSGNPDSPQSGATFQSSVTTPTAPSSASVTVLSSSGLRLNWTDNASTETGYRVERSPNGSTGWTTLVTLGANANQHSDYSVSAGTAYYYRVFAVNGAGDSTAVSANGTTWTLSEQWRYNEFGSTAATGSAADSATPAQDGVPNLIKYALGLDPQTPSAHLLPKPAVATGSISLSITLSSSATDVSLTFLQSTNLVDWTAVPAGNITNSGQTRTATLTVPTSAGNPVMLKFDVSR